MFSKVQSGFDKMSKILRYVSAHSSLAYENCTYVELYLCRVDFSKTKSPTKFKAVRQSYKT